MSKQRHIDVLYFGEHREPVYLSIAVDQLPIVLNIMFGYDQSTIDIENGLVVTASITGEGAVTADILNFEVLDPKCEWKSLHLDDHIRGSFVVYRKDSQSIDRNDILKLFKAIKPYRQEVI